MTTIEESSEAAERTWKEKGKRYAIFRGRNEHPEYVENPIFWYALDLDASCSRLGEGRRCLIQPFSKTANQQLLSTVVAVGSKIYCLGGGTFGFLSHPSDKVNSFDVACFTDIFDGAIDESKVDQEWVECSPLLYPRCKPQAAVADGKIIVSGGLDRYEGDFGGFSFAEYYDPTTQTWHLLDALLDGQSLYQLLNPEGTKPFDFTMAPVVGSPMVIFTSKSSSLSYNVVTGSLVRPDYHLITSDSFRAHHKDTQPFVLGRVFYVLEPFDHTLLGFVFGTRTVVLDSVIQLFDKPGCLPNWSVMLRMDQLVDMGGSQLHLICIGDSTTGEHTELFYQCADIAVDTGAPNHRGSLLQALYKGCGPFLVDWYTSIIDGLLLKLK